jgi:hypothetical protein
MTERHLDEGIIQAYIDGELSHEHRAATSAHLAACAACSDALAAAEGESSFFAAAFATDDSLPVPTAALRARVNAAVAQLEASKESEPQRSQGWSLGGFFASLPSLFTFTPRAAAAFATLLLAVAAGIIYFSSQKSGPAPAAREVAQATNPEPTVTTTPEKVIVQKSVEPDGQGSGGAGYVQAKHNPRPVKRRQAAPATVKEEALSGEREYRTAIASLEKTIKLGGDESLRPALRADYERNLALLDSAIAQTRQVAAQNPKDKDAVGFLMAAYQSKVELLSRVADQAQVATLGR